MKLLVLGGAGYVGSHFVREAVAVGHEVVVYDSLELGHQAAVPANCKLVTADIRDTKTLQAIHAEHQFDVVLHFAAYALVAESVANPEKYFDNNVGGTQSVINALQAVNPVPIVFSSTCAVYGIPEQVPIHEGTHKRPLSPYGESKLECEGLLQQYAASSGRGVYALRYFNACGAAADGSIGEDHKPETHLIPNILRSAHQGEPLTIFGDQFPTPDGSCVRDYIHVTDLGVAHLAAAKRLVDGKTKEFRAVNLGTGQGYSNLQVVAAAAKVVGRQVDYEIGPPRAGDPPELYADNSLARVELGFEPRHSSLENILSTAWKWHSEHPQGFAR